MRFLANAQEYIKFLPPTLSPSSLPEYVRLGKFYRQLNIKTIMDSLIQQQH